MINTEHLRAEVMAEERPFLALKNQIIVTGCFTQWVGTRKRSKMGTVA